MYKKFVFLCCQFLIASTNTTNSKIITSYCKEKIFQLYLQKKFDEFWTDINAHFFKLKDSINLLENRLNKIELNQSQNTKISNSDFIFPEERLIEIDSRIKVLESRIINFENELKSSQINQEFRAQTFGLLDWKKQYDQCIENFEKIQHSIPHSEDKSGLIANLKLLVNKLDHINAIWDEFPEEALRALCMLGEMLVQTGITKEEFLEAEAILNRILIVKNQYYALIADDAYYWLGILYYNQLQVPQGAIRTNSAEYGDLIMKAYTNFEKYIQYVPQSKKSENRLLIAKQCIHSLSNTKAFKARKSCK